MRSNGDVEGPPRSARSSAAGAHCLPSASGADKQAVHGPLQRLLDGGRTRSAICWKSSAMVPCFDNCVFKEADQFAHLAFR